MSRIFAEELQRLDAAVVENAARVEDAVRLAAAALERGDADLARRVVDADDAIDRRRAEIEEECLKLIALHQPVAADLRHLIGVVKINLHLERVGDLAANLARKARGLAGADTVPTPAILVDMAARAAAMVHDAIDAFVENDVEKARDVVNRDAAVDRLKREVRRYCEAAIRADPERVRARVIQIAAARNLERIGDMAVNIARCLVYAVTGESLRPLPGDGDEADPAPDAARAKEDSEA